MALEDISTKINSWKVLSEDILGGRFDSNSIGKQRALKKAITSFEKMAEQYSLNEKASKDLMELNPTYEQLKIYSQN